MYCVVMHHMHHTSSNGIIDHEIIEVLYYHRLPEIKTLSIERSYEIKCINVSKTFKFKMKQKCSTSGLKGHCLKARTTSTHSRRSKSRGVFLVSTLSSAGRFLSDNLAKMFLAPGPSKLGVRSARKSCATYVQAYIPDTFSEGGRFLDEKLAEAVVPVIEVPAYD